MLSYAAGEDAAMSLKPGTGCTPKGRRRLQVASRKSQWAQVGDHDDVVRARSTSPQTLIYVPTTLRLISQQHPKESHRSHRSL